jgi:hypothetical protein
VTLRTSIVAAGALLALLVPTAANAREVTNLYTDGAVAVAHSNHGVKSSALRSSKKKGGRTTARTRGSNGAYTAPFGSSSIVTPRYIYVPAPATVSSSYVDPNECQDSGNACTGQQLCQFWGENCDSQAPVDAAPGETSGDTNPN